MNFKNLANKNFNNSLSQKKIYDLIIKHLNHSIFKFLDFKNFKKIYFNSNKNLIFVNFLNNKLNCLITYLPKKEEARLKKFLLIYMLKNPSKFFFFLINPINFFKEIKPPKNYLQLFHFINLNLRFINKKKKYFFINRIHKKVCYNKYKGIYVIYKNSNLNAHKYYMNNNFRIYKKNIFYSLAIRKF